MLTFAQDLAVARSQHGGNERTCACGCPLPRSGNSAYATAACRTRAWKRRTGYRKPHRARENAGNGPRTGKNARSGRQLSYQKARKELLDRMWQFVGAERLIDEALQAALPERQRKGPA